MRRESEQCDRENRLRYVASEHEQRKHKKTLEGEPPSVLQRFCRLFRALTCGWFLASPAERCGLGFGQHP